MTWAISYGYPYAMIATCGGGKLAAILSYDAKTDEYLIRTMARHWSDPDWSSLYKTPRRIISAEVVETWRHPPSATAIARAAKAARKAAIA